MSKKAGKTSKAPELKINKQPIKKQLIYLGPTIPNVVRHANVFNGELPEALKKCVEETEGLSLLIVPIDRTSELVKELKKQSAAASIYAAVAKKYNI